MQPLNVQDTTCSSGTPADNFYLYQTGNLQALDQTEGISDSDGFKTLETYDQLFRTNLELLYPGLVKILRTRLRYKRNSGEDSRVEKGGPNAVKKCSNLI